MLCLQQRATKLRMSYSIVLYVALSLHGIKSILQKLSAAVPITNEEMEALRNLPRVTKSLGRAGNRGCNPGAGYYSKSWAASPLGSSEVKSRPL